MNKPIYFGCAILELSNLHLYETQYDNLQPNAGEESLQLHYENTDGMILSMKTQNLINYSKSLEDIFDFSVG